MCAAASLVKSAVLYHPRRGHRRAGSTLHCPGGVPCHIPQVSIWILEISGIPSPECVLSRFDDFRSGFFGLRHHFIYFLFAVQVVSNSEFRCAWILQRESGIVSDALSRPKGKLRAVFQVDKDDSAILEFFTNDAIGF